MSPSVGCGRASAISAGSSVSSVVWLRVGQGGCDIRREDPQGCQIPTRETSPPPRRPARGPPSPATRPPVNGGGGRLTFRRGGGGADGCSSSKMGVAPANAASSAFRQGPTLSLSPARSVILSPRRASSAVERSRRCLSQNLRPGMPTIGMLRSTTNLWGDLRAAVDLFEDEPSLRGFPPLVNFQSTRIVAIPVVLQVVDVLDPVGGIDGESSVGGRPSSYSASTSIDGRRRSTPGYAGRSAMTSMIAAARHRSRCWIRWRRPFGVSSFGGERAQSG